MFDQWAAGSAALKGRPMLPIIGSFILSVAGSMLGKALWRVWESRDGAAAAAGKAQPGAAPFANVLKEQSQRYAQAPGATATDLPTGSAALPVASVNFASLTARAGTSAFPLSDIQTA